MDKVLLALGGVALGVAAYTLGEMVQERRAEMGEDYGVLDLIDEWIDGVGNERESRQERVVAKEEE